MVTGILQCIVLPLFNAGQTHFTNRMLTGILQGILFNTGQTHFTNRMLTGILLYAVLSLCYYRSKDPFLFFFYFINNLSYRLRQGLRGH